jgi:L,D-peptidoglycan transpeptidase YkuD (ErfK/YbiS/YcfS/YnhG family)
MSATSLSTLAMASLNSTPLAAASAVMPVSDVQNGVMGVSVGRTSCCTWRAHGWVSSLFQTSERECECAVGQAGYETSERECECTVGQAGYETSERECECTVGRAGYETSERECECTVGRAGYETSERECECTVGQAGYKSVSVYEDAYTCQNSSRVIG